MTIRGAKNMKTIKLKNNDKFEGKIFVKLNYYFYQKC